MVRVIVVKCSSYDEKEVYSAMRAGIGALGGMHALISDDSSILVKPNYLSYADPDRAVTTHPTVIKTMLRILNEDGYGKVTYGDSPGHGSNLPISEKLGITEAAARYGAVPADMDTETEVCTSEGATAKVLHLCRGVAEADAIINLCKMKTHQLERITGAMKNVYGFVCGSRKAAGHVKYPNSVVFAGVLADIHKSTNIRLHIMDGVLAMEGNGPSAGDPVKMNVMLFSTDPVALDTVYCSLIELDPELVPTCTQGQIKGVGTCDMKEIELLAIDPADDLKAEPSKAEQQKSEQPKSGQAKSEQPKSEQPKLGSEKAAQADPEIIDEAELKRRFGNSSFKVDREGESHAPIRVALGMLDIFTRRPVIKRELCVRCGICVNHCPVPGKAISFKNGRDNPPVYDYHKCIRCYCCQEMCPQKAISVKRGI